MNRYELAHHEVMMALQERSIMYLDANHALATDIVDRLIAAGVIQSTEPGDLVRGGER